MKRYLSILIILITSFFLAACNNQPSPRALLIRQYDEYIDNDILENEAFDYFINQVSNFIIPGTVVVKAVARDAMNQVRDVREGTGFVYAIFENSLRVVTSLETVKITDETWTLTVEIMDFANRSYSALVLNRSEEYNLAKIKFDTNVAISKIRRIDVSAFVPMDYEPLMMISNYQLSRNSMLMGLLIEKDAETGLYKTDIPADEYALGGAVINTRRQVIGMVVDVEEGFALLLGVTQLRTYLNL